MSGDLSISQLNGKEIYLPDGRLLGIVGEQGVHLTIPWRWIRSIGDVVILRWFPKTPIPYEH